MYRKDDSKIIIKAYKEIHDIDIDEKTAIFIWAQYSDLYACGWCGGVETLSPQEICSLTEKYLNLYEIFIRKAYNSLINRYISKINSFGGAFVSIPKASKEHILDMLETLKNEENLDKTARWIGYIQGVLTVNQAIFVEEEMDFSRPLFQKAYNYL